METLTAKETMQILGVSRAYLYTLIDNGELTPIRQETILMQPRLKFDKSEVEALLKKDRKALRAAERKKAKVA